MPMKKKNAKSSATSPDLSLSVQYGTPSNELARWRIRRWVQRAIVGAHQSQALDCARAILTVVILNEKQALSYNESYRGKAYATNVLTFEYGCDPDGTLSADIVLCLPVLKKEAREQKKPLLHHAAHLVIHGTLHALGYDHEDNRDAQRMESLETEILSNMRIPDPYLAR